MFIEAIDQLRCVRDHEESWLIASFTEMRGRDLWAGELGCHICGARYPVVNGVAQFSASATIDCADYENAGAEDELVALAAVLNLTEIGKTVALSGEWTEFALELTALVDVVIFTINARAAIPPHERIHPIVAEIIPVRKELLDGVAIGRNDSEGMLQSAVHVLKPGGRLVVPHTHKLPDGINLLAIDDAKWVAEKSHPLTSLRRASR